MFRRIMVAYDESPEAARALRAAIELTKSLSGELLVVSVVEPLPIYFSFSTLAQPAVDWKEEKRTTYTDLQTEARRLATDAGVPFSAELVDGDEVGSIVGSAVKHRVDLLVLGLHRHRWLVGHTAQDLAERAPCSLLGVK